MKPAPKEWSVKNGAFIGSCLVLRDIPSTSVPGKMLPAKDEDWLPYAIDLRPINAIKQYGFQDGEDRLTSLFHNNTFVACINAPIGELMDYWLDVRHVYDAPEFYDPNHPSQL